MTNPYPIHAKAQERERLLLVDRAARAFAGRGPADGRVVLREGAYLDDGTFSDGGDGRLFTLDLAPQDVEVSATSGPLILGRIDGDKYAADRAAPVRKVKKQFGNLMQFVTASDLSKLVRPLGGGGGGAQPVRANPTVSSPTYAAKEYALDAGVPAEVLANADHDLGLSIGSYLADMWRLSREFEVADLLTNSAKWSSTNILAPTNGKWSASGLPVNDLFGLLQLSRNPRPNLLVMSEFIARYWYSNSTVQAFYMTGGFEELKLEIVTVGVKTASAGANAANQTDIWSTPARGNNVVLLRTGKSDGVADPSTAATARWKGDEIRSVPRGEVWVCVDDVLIRTFWEPRVGARGLSDAVLVVNEGVIFMDNTIGGIITNVA